MRELLAGYPGLWPGVALLFGLLVGSFLNVVILRLPKRMEWEWRRDCREILGLLPLPPSLDPAPPGIVVESSHCPKCGHRLAPWENVPVLSWLLLRGRCRSCRTPISLQYPVVELVTGLLALGCALAFGASWAALAAMGFSFTLVALSGIDLRTTYLPDQLTYPLLWAGLLLSLLPDLSPLGVTPLQSILGATVGYLSLWTVYWGFKLLTGKEGMGYGDFKLLAALGAWCGAEAILSIVLVSSIIGAIVGTTWLWLRGRDRATPIPFGPYLAIAGWIQLVFQPDLLALSDRLFGM